MRIATWNVNSLNARMPRVEEWLDYAMPDVLCLQETKFSDDKFPALAFQAVGYESVHHGQGQWNGVAILSKASIDDVHYGFADGGEADTDARLVTATCGGVRVSSVYVPNGREIDHEQYHYKLAWLARLREHLEALGSADDDVVVCGDYNIAPTDIDVWDPAEFAESTHVTEPERGALAELSDWGLVDVFREHYDDAGLYTYWDYRDGNFHKRKGMRIDLMLASRPVADRSTLVLMDRSARKGKLPSDHAPLFMDVA